MSSVGAFLFQVVAHDKAGNSSYADAYYTVVSSAPVESAPVVSIGMSAPVKVSSAAVP